MSPSSSAFPSPRQAAALLVGINDYRPRYRIPPLQFAVNDAESLAAVLKDPNLCAFPSEKVKVLAGKRATRQQVYDHLVEWLPKHARDAEVVFIFFAGHGTVEREGQREEGYLLPFDADPGRLMTTAIRMSDLNRLIDPDHLKARSLVVCLDCCHAAQVIPRGTSVRAQERNLVLPRSALNDMIKRSRFILASCDDGQKSLEVEGLQHGLFSYHLIEGLRGAGDRDGDGKVSVAELFSYVASTVREEARARHRHEQQPWAGQLYGEEVVLSIPRQPNGGGGIPGPAGEPGQPLFAEGRDPAKLPALFRSLAHPQEVIRRNAHKAIQEFGWDAAARALVERAGQTPAEEMGWVLDGLNAYEADLSTVDLLNRLEGVLRGDLRRRAAELYDLKSLGLSRGPLAAAFREVKSPYQIERVLGPGTYTAAYLARKETTDSQDRTLTHRVVVRVLRPEYADRPAVRARFLELSHLSEKLVHQNLVLTREVRHFPEHRLVYAVRDFIEGQTLRDRLEKGRPFSPLEVVFLIQAVVQGLTPLHELGQAHRGIKPSNLFLAAHDRLKVGDPSLPVVADDWNYKRVAYDFRYSAPESFNPAAPSGRAADLYSLACVVHEILRGAPPFVSDNPYDLSEQHRRDPVPRGDRTNRIDLLFDDWLQLMLAKSVGDRSANEATATAKLEEIKFLLRRVKAPASATGESPSGRVPDSRLPGARTAPAGTFDSIDLLDDQSVGAPNAYQSLVPFLLAPEGDEPARAAHSSSPAPAASHPATTVPDTTPPGHSPASLDSGLIRCPFCHTMNNAGLIFCETCKSDLTGIPSSASVGQAVQTPPTSTSPDGDTGPPPDRDVLPAAAPDTFGTIFLRPDPRGPDHQPGPAQATLPSEPVRGESSAPQTGLQPPQPAPTSEVEQTVIPTSGLESSPTPVPLNAPSEWSPTSTRAGEAGSDITPAGPSLPSELATHPRYEVVRPLGQGGMGTVYLARHRFMQRPVALKVISHSLISEPAVLQRFLAEVKAASALSHPNIVTAFDAEQAGTLHFLVMEYVEGASLSEHVKRKGPLPVHRACELTRQAALGLQHAHDRGMVHRDIKPSNLMLTQFGQVKILDFGLARLGRKQLSGEGLTRSGTFLGTPEYVAPEQAFDASQADARSDVYSLGCALYYLLTGQPPFIGVNAVMTRLTAELVPVHRLRPEVPEALSAVAARMLERDPARRYQSAAEVAQALAPFCKREEGAEASGPLTSPELALKTSPPPSRPLIRARSWRSWRWWAVALFLAVVLPVLAVSLFLQINPTARTPSQSAALLPDEVEALLNGPAALAPNVLSRLGSDPTLREPAQKRLKELWDELAPGSQSSVGPEAAGKRRAQRMRVGLGLLPTEPDRVKWALLDWMLKTDDAAERTLIRDQLAPHAEDLIPHLRERAEGAQGTTRQRIEQALKELEAKRQAQ